jgi:catechol 2,3-dioxygenase-like lactoylglutathione lyase family enzyme
MGSQYPFPDRRRFLAWSSGAAAFFAAHGLGMAEEPTGIAANSTGHEDVPHIRSLELLSGAPLATMKKFYHESLGLPVVEDTTDRLTIGAGQTLITFLPASAEYAKPFYHFAFNIPQNKLLAAHRWQQQRTPLLPIPAKWRDAKFPSDVVHYRSWNAHSIFFFDPAGNVVEYIARHNLKNASDSEFGSEDILYASEIAFVVDDVSATAKKLRQITTLKQYKGAFKQFAAVGDEHGLLLVMGRGRVISFGAPEKKAVDVYPTTTTIQSATDADYVFPEFPYQISMKQ